MNGAKEIVPVGSLDFSKIASASSFGGRTMRGGEKNTKKIEGFDLGNSPAEYSEEKVSGKSIVFFTTNGSKAIVKSKYSTNSYICSFLNIAGVAKNAVKKEGSLEIVCSGRNGDFSLEDTVCAGMLIKEIMKIEPEVELSDASLVALDLAEKYGDKLLDMFKISEHGKILLAAGFEDDLKYCAQLNITDVVPVFSNNTIKFLTPKKDTPNK
ncbi:MAG: hypothetical protein B6D45_08635 [Ignavibacteriales bacterium UTCHB3]|nr:MAG: hypothetical protein B6D45_08635 [Ignavibacteriales bacterium UTCHB3]